MSLAPFDSASTVAAEVGACSSPGSCVAWEQLVCVCCMCRPLSHYQHLLALRHVHVRQAGSGAVSCCRDAGCSPACRGRLVHHPHTGLNMRQRMFQERSQTLQHRLQSGVRNHLRRVLLRTCLYCTQRPALTLPPTLAQRTHQVFRLCRHCAVSIDSRSCLNPGCAPSFAGSYVCCFSATPATPATRPPFIDVVDRRLVRSIKVPISSSPTSKLPRPSLRVHAHLGGVSHHHGAKTHASGIPPAAGDVCYRDGR
jgi:hypothetical protein